MPSASISAAAISTATVSSASIATAAISNASISALTVSGDATFGGTGTVTGQWNYTVQPKHNSNVLATKSYVDAQILNVTGSGLTETLNTLGEIASAIAGDPSFATTVTTAYVSLSSAIVVEASARSVAVSAAASNLASAAASLTTVDVALSGALAAESTARSTAVLPRNQPPGQPPCRPRHPI